MGWDETSLPYCREIQKEGIRAPERNSGKVARISTNESRLRLRLRRESRISHLFSGFLESISVVIANYCTVRCAPGWHSCCFRAYADADRHFLFVVNSVLQSRQATAWPGKIAPRTTCFCSKRLLYYSTSRTSPDSRWNLRCADPWCSAGGWPLAALPRCSPPSLPAAASMALDDPNPHPNPPQPPI